MKICEKLTVKDGWVNGFTHHRNGNHGGPLTTPAVKGLLEHTTVGNLRHTDAMFTPTPERSGNSAHFGTAQDGTVIQWVQLGVVAFHAFDANFHWYGWRMPITATRTTRTATRSSRVSRRSSS
jgi:hypothetical protein